MGTAESSAASVQFEGVDIPVVVRRSERRKRIACECINGALHLHTPRTVSDAEACAHAARFTAARPEWLREQLRPPPAAEGTLLFEGHELPFAFRASPRRVRTGCELVNGTLRILVPPTVSEAQAKRDAIRFIEGHPQWARERLGLPLHTERLLSFEERELPLVIQRSRRRKRIGFELINGELRVRVPASVNDERACRIAADFVHQEREWVRRRLVAPAVPVLRDQLREGGRLPYLGRSRPVRIRADAADPVSLDEDGFILQAADAGAAEQWFRAALEREIGPRLERWQGCVGTVPSAVEIWASRSSWGDCQRRTSRLRFDWRLIFAPPELLDYVIVHELCHLREANHSAEFWRLVSAVFPDAPRCRRALRVLEHQLRWDPV